jgi:hypothetical protein
MEDVVEPWHLEYVGRQSRLREPDRQNMGNTAKHKATGFDRLRVRAAFAM